MTPTHLKPWHIAAGIGDAPADISPPTAKTVKTDKTPGPWRPMLDALVRAPAAPDWHPRAWAQMIEGAGAMLADHGADLTRYGWTAPELFGLDAAAPWRRIDRVGVCRFLVDGWRVSRVRADAIEITTPQGNALVRLRCAGRPGLALAWEIGR